MLTTALHIGPKSHGRLVTDEELELAEYRPGYDYEVIYGRLYVSPAPNREHDIVEKHIYKQLVRYSDIRPDIAGYVTDRARVFVASEELTTSPEPDLAIYAVDHDGSWRDEEPFIVGEVLRDNSVDKDLFRNVALYWRVPTIQEYWVFDIRAEPRRPSLLVHRRGANCWETREYPADAIYETPLLPELKLKLALPPRTATK